MTRIIAAAAGLTSDSSGQKRQQEKGPQRHSWGSGHASAADMTTPFLSLVIIVARLVHPRGLNFICEDCCFVFSSLIWRDQPAGDLSLFSCGPGRARGLVRDRPGGGWNKIMCTINIVPGQARSVTSTSLE